MRTIEHLQMELRAALRRVGANTLDMRQSLNGTRMKVNEEAVRNDETDAALVELGDLSAENAMSAEEVMTAQVELAGMVDEALTRADEQDAALVEIAGMLAETLATNE